MRKSVRYGFALMTAAGLALTLEAAERVTLHPGNFKEYAPAGKEADAIFGDYVLRNDRITAVVADPTLCRGRSAGRKNAPMPLGVLIDLTRRDRPNDLLMQFDPTYTQCLSRRELYADGDPGEPGHQKDFVDEAERYKEPGRQPLTNETVTLTLPYKKPGVEVRYTLADGWDHIRVDMVFDTTSLKSLQPPFQPASMIYLGPESLGASKQLVFGGDSPGPLVWIYDPWFGQAYGVTDEKPLLRPYIVDNRPSMLFQQWDPKTPFVLPASPQVVVTRRVYPASDLFHLRSLVNAAAKTPEQPVSLTVSAKDGPVTGTRVTAYAGSGKSVYGMGTTDDAGKLACTLPAGTYRFVIEPFGRRKQVVEVNPATTPNVTIECEPAARLRLAVTDGDGKAMPCKAVFQEADGTNHPFFFPPNGSNRVRNVAYAADGRLEQILAPGRYRVAVSHGPEYDSALLDVALEAGQSTSAVLRLARLMDTTGWISTEFGSRTTLSRGFSLADVKGRVLNLAAEQIEFAPPGERDQVFTYEDTIRELGLEPFLKSCPGIGLTERVRKTVTSQNAFPVKYTPGAQDGGAVQRPQHIYQVFWLNGWYGPLTHHGDTAYASDWEKLIQVTPPDIHENDGKWHGMWALFQDPGLPNSLRNGIEQVHRNSRLIELALYHAMEVQPLTNFLGLADFDPADPDGAADIAAWQRTMDDWARTKEWPELKRANLDWLRMLNMGYRITGVVNNNGTQNYNGSGVFRNYIKLGTDDPARIEPLAVVAAVKKGRVVMSTGPFLDVTVAAGGKTAGPGDDLSAPDGKAVLQIRAQAPRNTVLDSVRVLFNGRPVPALARTRASHPGQFADGTVQFEGAIPLELTVDTRVMVLVSGRSPGGVQAALSNPVYVDLGQDGFRPFPPWQDRVFTRMDLAAPLGSAKDAAPADVSLKIKNMGTSPAADSFSVRLLPAGVAEVVGENRYSYKLAPGEQTEIRIRLRYLGTGKRVRVSVARSSAGVGRRPVALTLDLDKKPEASTRPSALVEQNWWLPQHDAARPADLQWDEFGR